MEVRAETPRRDRAYVEKQHLDAYRALAGIGEGRQAGSGENLPPFKSLKDVFLLAMCVGVQTGRRTPLRQRNELFLANYLNNQDFAVIRAIALCETGRADVVGDHNELLTIAEEYANTGFGELQRELLGGGPPLVRLIQLVVERTGGEASDVGKPNSR